MQQRLGADIDGYLVRTAGFAATLAASAGEVEEAQRLRYRVFADEFGACIPGSPQGLDRDDLDAFCHHLLVRERESGALVGTYRILPAERARSAGGFYAEREFDLRGLRGLQRVTVRSAEPACIPTSGTGPSSRSSGRRCSATSPLPAAATSWDARV